MLFELPQLYAITDTRLSGLSHGAQITRLAAGGATLIQLREKHLSSRAFYDAAEEALRSARSLGVQLIINDRVDIALALQADGVHLGQRDLPPEVARKLLGRNAIIGVSVHNAEQAQNALSFPIDYVAAGPVFTTDSKENPDPVLGLSGLRAIRRVLGKRPLVAIGGINQANAIAVLQSGADTVALLSELIKNPDTIEATTRALIRQLGSETSKN
ncbi:MAG: thiamine-phosphate pyrophosphorylase [Blastocatellia bacterium]|jgi:thiamine-phosphate pyrophosphorylase|nr:thiamine-phosphate pyrophosphorylase [Blastocatellia bacterium]